MKVTGSVRKDIDFQLRGSFVREGQIMYRFEWQGVQDREDPRTSFLELTDVDIDIRVPADIPRWQEICNPNLPWAEDHFKERISGEPLNPPPSSSYWPYAQQDNAEFKADEKFSHTYPERFWPRDLMARGIRYPTGDYTTFQGIIRSRPRTRQAYLPIWFPEDLSASAYGDRVPCTLGYLIQWNQKTHAFDMWYYMRSCDFHRYLWDDIYMAGRLLQETMPTAPGTLHMKIANLHVFADERPLIKREFEDEQRERLGHAFG